MKVAFTPCEIDAWEIEAIYDGARRLLSGARLIIWDEEGIQSDEDDADDFAGVMPATLLKAVSPGTTERADTLRPISLRPAPPEAELPGFGTSGTTPRAERPEQEVLRLYDAGLNVFPIQPASKKPYGRWNILKTTRLYRPGLPALVADSNLAVLTGRLSGNLFVLDCDSKEAFECIGQKLEVNGIMPWACVSGRGGHYWLRCAEGEVENQKHGDRELRGHHSYVLVPPSIQSSGKQYFWKYRCGDIPCVPLADLDFLAELGFLPLTLCQTNGKSHLTHSSGLPPKAHQLLTTAPPAGCDNSQREFTICLSMIGAGMSDDEIIAMFWNYRPPHFIKKGEPLFRTSVLAAAREKHRPLPLRHGANGFRLGPAAPYLSFASARPWPGRTGNSDREVYRALCHRYGKDGRMPFRASIRELAESANVANGTAQRSIQRLITAELISKPKEKRDKESQAYCFYLADPGSHESFVDTLKTTVGDYVPSVSTMHPAHIDPAHDLWAFRALGKSALEVYRLLSVSSPLRQIDIVKGTGKCKTTVRRALNNLELYGLVEQGDDGWIAHETTIARLEQIARYQGTEGNTRRKKARNEQDRQIRATEQIAWTKARWMNRKNQP